ncbi:MAG: hypothetical protein J5I98_30500 [Phaeodactylibacter sp.]|nr:hypothetical protein [Phaeodactylibacter sp.]
MKLQHIDFFPDSFFVGALFPFVEDGKLFLLAVQYLDKYKKGEANTKLPGGSGDRRLASETKYFARLEEVLEALSFDRRAVLLILNQEYSRRAQFEDHPLGGHIIWLLQTLVLKCLEATGYYPASLDPSVVDVVKRSDDHYQYFLEIKEWWDQHGGQVQIPQPDEEFVPLDKDVVVPRQKMPLLEFEEILIESHCRPVEFYLERLKESARQAREGAEDEEA